VENTKTKKRIGILRGGKGKNYGRSLKNGGEVISHINKNLADKYSILDILVDTDGVWHLNGLPVSPSDLVSRVDIVWNLSHPSLSNILENLAIPNVGASAFSYALESSSDLLREHIKGTGVQMPRSILLPVYQKDFDGPRERYSIKKAKEVHEKFGAPWIVKSFTPDISMGIHLAKTFNELVTAIEDGVKHEKSILVEEFIEGKIASIHSLRGFRNEDYYTFPLGNAYGVFSGEEKENLQNITKSLHQHLGAEHYLKSDYILTPRNKIYLIGIALHPDLKIGSHLSEVCEFVGTNIHKIVEHLLESANI
jgi:D-alanine-D-alanine ligase